MSFFAAPITLQSNADGSLMQRGGMSGGIEQVTKVAFLLIAGFAAALRCLGGCIALRPSRDHRR